MEKVRPPWLKLTDKKVIEISPSHFKHPIKLNFLIRRLERPYPDKKLILEKRVMYDHTVDQKGYKWSGKSILKKVDTKTLVLQ